MVGLCYWYSFVRDVLRDGFLAFLSGFPLHPHALTPTPEQQRQYDELVAAIVRAVPECRDGGKCHCCNLDPCDHSTTGCPWLIGRTPGLEDVLRATNGIWMGVSHTGYMARMNFTSLLPGGEYWHLGHDLAWHRDNAPETIKFLHSLLLP